MIYSDHETQESDVQTCLQNEKDGFILRRRDESKEFPENSRATKLAEISRYYSKDSLYTKVLLRIALYKMLVRQSRDHHVLIERSSTFLRERDSARSRTFRHDRDSAGGELAGEHFDMAETAELAGEHFDVNETAPEGSSQ